MTFLLAAIMLQSGTAAPVASATVPSIGCVYDALTPDERIAVLGTAVSEGLATATAHTVAVSKVKTIALGCAKRSRWTQQQTVQAAAYAASRSALSVAVAELSNRGAEVLLVDEIADNLTPAQRNALLLGKVDPSLMQAIINTAGKKPGFRKAMLDNSHAVSAGRLLGRAVAGKVAMQAAERGNLDIPGIPR